MLSIGENEVVIEARGRPIIVPRSGLDQLAVRPSDMWTLVPREWGGPYLVCPSCAERVGWRRSLVQLQCRRCDGVFRVVLDAKHGGRPAERAIGGD